MTVLSNRIVFGRDVVRPPLLSLPGKGELTAFCNAFNGTAVVSWTNTTPSNIDIWEIPSRLRINGATAAVLLPELLPLHEQLPLRSLDRRFV